MYFVEETKGINYLKQFDYILFCSVLLLTITGLVVLSSATMTMSGGPSIMRTQIVSIVLGLIAALVMSSFDYKNLKSIGFIFYFGCIGMLVYVLRWGVGYETFGSRSWISILGLLTFQPSELMKIASVIVSATLLERMKEGNDVRRNTIKFIFYAMLPIVLILLQPDYGMAMIFIVGFIILIYIYGIKYKYIFMFMGLLVGAFPFVWFFMLNDRRKQRILEFFFPGSEPTGSSWQLDRAELAIGSGRIFGSGLYKGIQTQNNLVPVKESDMIFSVIGEELGFIGSVFVLILILIIIYRCIYIAKNAQDDFGAFLVMGIIGMMGFQFLQNIGMCLRLMPLTGLPLPFVSQGGSAMVTNYLSIGIILSVSLRRKRAMFQNSQ
ncbi:MAG TPA: rod shape-determining protein RodA [Clostridiaceae bacterium]|nr:rod shape-determining protein RodA [Clostridiaceae bacterium]